MIDVEDLKRMKRRFEAWEKGEPVERFGVEYEKKRLQEMIDTIEKSPTVATHIVFGKSPVIATMGDGGVWHEPEKEDHDKNN